MIKPCAVKLHKARNSSMSVSSGARLGPYEVLAPIGAGGMGEVYRAKDTRLGREVALKILPAAVRFTISAPEQVSLLLPPTVSPDGRNVAFQAVSDTPQYTVMVNWTADLKR